MIDASAEGVPGCFKSGCVEVHLKKDRVTFERAVIQATPEPLGLFLTLNLEDTRMLNQVLEDVFGQAENRTDYIPPQELWEGTSFSYLAPLCDRQDYFWICVGPLSTSVPTERMKTIFEDLKSALNLVGGRAKYLN